MKKYLLLLSVLAGALLSVGWPSNGLPAFLFTAFIPFLFIEDYIFNHRNQFSRFSVFFYVYPGLLIWNFATTWWVWNSTPVAAAAWILNALFMGIVFNVFHLIRRNIYPSGYGYFILAFSWIAFEYLHLSWRLTWPWLTLGNGFANQVTWVQWYEFTGHLGGSLWILIINILLFKGLKELIKKQKERWPFIKHFIMAGMVLLIPMIISYILYYQYQEDKDPIHVVVTQPNLDPWSEQYTVDPVDVINLNLELADPYLDSDERMFIVAPESAIQEGIWEGRMEASPSLRRIHTFINENPDVSIIIGASTYKQYAKDEVPPFSARKHSMRDYYYDRYNTAFYIDHHNVQLHHKSKLTPGVEYMPSFGILSFLEDFAIDLGGTVGTLGVDKELVPFTTKDSIQIAPVICYESVFGDFCRQYVKKGASVIFIITNDGWWGHSPGHRQHFNYGALRAIENRRSIARSANTGISAFYNQRGDALQATEYWEKDVIYQEINLNYHYTFYTLMGDYIGRISAFVFVLLMLVAIVNALKRKSGLKV